MEGIKTYEVAKLLEIPYSQVINWRHFIPKEHQPKKRGNEIQLYWNKQSIAWLEKIKEEKMRGVDNHGKERNNSRRY